MKTNCGPQLFKMLAQSHKAASARSTTLANSKLKASSLPKTKQTFWAFLWRRIAETFAKVWGFSRRALWITSTGVIMVVLPFAFAYFMEMQKELMKVQGGGAPF